MKERIHYLRPLLLGGMLLAAALLLGRGPAAVVHAEETALQNGANELRTEESVGTDHQEEALLQEGKEPLSDGESGQGREDASGQDSRAGEASANRDAAEEEIPANKDSGEEKDTAGNAAGSKDAQPNTGAGEEDGAAGNMADTKDVLSSTDAGASAEDREEATQNSAAALEEASEAASEAAAPAGENASSVTLAQKETNTALQPQASTTYVNMYRLYNPNTGEHFYTASLEEMVSVTQAGWQYEGVGWVAPETSTTPVYRLYNPNAGDHHYTASKEECDRLVAAGWKYEGIGWYSDTAEGALAVLRQYNANAAAGTHNFTKSTQENAALIKAGWKPEGTAWYASNVGTQTITGRWIVTAAWGSLQRYWLDATAVIAKSRLITAEDGAGYTAYATSSGAVVRGSYDSGAGYVYLADNAGRLVSGTANTWLVTGAYTGGALQRYYLIEKNGALVVRTSAFEVDGAHYYGMAKVGYVLRGKLRFGNGMLLANNEGKMAWTEGWLVTGIYDGGALQRYRIDSSPGSGLMGAHIGEFVLDGKRYYGRSDTGYVYRNALVTVGSTVYQANNDGVLTYVSDMADMFGRIKSYSSGTGWLIAVDRTAHQVGIFKGSANNWTLYDSFACVTGTASTPTLTGTYRTTGLKKSALSTDRRAIYCTQIWGGYFFHSVLNSTSELGKSLSHGCIRLAWDKANWIYQNIGGGTTVVIYN